MTQAMIAQERYYEILDYTGDKDIAAERWHAELEESDACEWDESGYIFEDGSFLRIE